ncbi:MAG: hypothetical protein LUH05_09775 [Candidatus Gastranaerophilales bacterium]|nr:hypothetical protein [Candidatus Gastranaerophilales bacterium]
MDLPPPVETQFAQISTIERSPADELYYIYVLSRIDAPDIPQNVKQYARDKNCTALVKIYYWSYKKFKGNDVFMCSKHRKSQFILAKDDNLRFANWLERRKLDRVYYEF